MKLVARYDYREGAKIPKSGPVIVVSNHVSYMDAFALAFLLYSHGRAPRFLGKSQVFRVPIIGKILLAAEQIVFSMITESSILQPADSRITPSI